MPAGYAATTQVESTWGDHFTVEISDLRISEQLPYLAGAAFPIHLQPNAGVAGNGQPGNIASPFGQFSRPSRRPSNIIPIGGPNPPGDVFYLGLDLEFVGTQLGAAGYPATVDVEVRFFLEAYGAPFGNDPVGTPPPTAHRHEINITPQVFIGLNADPNAGSGVTDRETRHSLWVEVYQLNQPQIIQAPVGPSWADLFTPETIYRVAAAVKIVNWTPLPPTGPDLTGFIEGLVIQTEASNPNLTALQP